MLRAARHIKVLLNLHVDLILTTVWFNVYYQQATIRLHSLDSWLLLYRLILSG